MYTNWKKSISNGLGTPRMISTMMKLCTSKRVSGRTACDFSSLTPLHAHGKRGAAESLLHPKLKQALSDEFQIHQLTHVQRSVLEASWNNKNVLCHDQTGSGKTLAYLLPLMHKIKLTEEKENEGKDISKVDTVDLGKARKPNRPKAIVLVPSRELAVQVTRVAKSLAHHIKLSVVGIYGGTKVGAQRKSLAKPIDLLIATPGRLKVHQEKQDIFFSSVHSLVVDEADTLFDRENGFLDDLLHVMKPVQQSALHHHQTLQYILAAATISPKVRALIHRTIDNLSTVSGEGYHQCPKSVSENFVRVQGSDDDSKHLALRNALRFHDKCRTIVFCNKTSSCQSTEHMLREHGFNSTSLHADIPSQTRQINFDAFLAGKFDVLVSTDIAARGLDIADLEHVINFDFPRTSTEYLHRVGRTGRVGRKGIATNLVTRRDIPVANLVQKVGSAKNRVEDLTFYQEEKEKKKERFTNKKMKEDQKIALSLPSGDDERRRVFPNPKGGRKGTKKIPAHKLRR